MSTIAICAVGLILYLVCWGVGCAFGYEEPGEEG